MNEDDPKFKVDDIVIYNGIKYVIKSVSIGFTCTTTYQDNMGVTYGNNTIGYTYSLYSPYEDKTIDWINEKDITLA